MEDGKRDEAAEYVGYAVEELPGNQLLIGWEASVKSGESVDLDPAALIPGLHATEKPPEQSE